MLSNNRRRIKVTRDNVRMPFVPPEMGRSPLNKTMMSIDVDWTDRDKKLDAAPPDACIPVNVKKARRREFDESRLVGHMIPRNRRDDNRVVLNRTGPSAAHREMRRRAEELAARRAGLV